MYISVLVYEVSLLTLLFGSFLQFKKQRSTEIHAPSFRANLWFFVSICCALCHLVLLPVNIELVSNSVVLKMLELSHSLLYRYFKLVLVLTKTISLVLISCYIKKLKLHLYLVN